METVPALVDPNYELILSNERISKARFKMFFTGLIFAVLSFIGAHPAHLDNRGVICLEVISLCLLFISGTILLAQLNEVWIIPKNPKNLRITTIKIINFINIHMFSSRLFYWDAFLLGMILIISVWSVALFLN